MEKAVFAIPSLWADHHTLAVRDVLCSLDGVEDVLASALHRRATVIYDSTMITPELMAESLDSAGYPVGADAIGHTSLADTSSSWSGNSSRVTVTNPVDLAMSGDYRKY